MYVLITVFDPVICKTQDAPLHCLPFCKVKWQHYEGMWQILYASFWKSSKLCKSGISFKLVHNWRSYNPQYNSLLFGPLCRYKRRKSFRNDVPPFTRFSGVAFPMPIPGFTRYASRTSRTGLASFVWCNVHWHSKLRSTVQLAHEM